MFRSVLANELASYLELRTRHLLVLKSMRLLEAAGHSVDMNDEIFTKYITMAKTAHSNKFGNGPDTPHMMRHTTAIHLMEAGVSLAVVKNILGHSSIQRTQIYLDISQQTVDRSMEKWNAICSQLSR